MSYVAIPKHQMKEILNRWMADFRVVAPVRENGLLQFKEIKSAEDAVISDEITYKSPKEFLFPQVEKIMSFENGENLAVECEQQKTIIFGIRPCDLDALKVLNVIFTEGKYVDTYFARQLENTILIGKACISEKPGCFCSVRGTDKGYSSACDAFVLEDENHYYANVLSSAGQSLFAGFDFGKVDVEKGVNNTTFNNPVTAAPAMLEIKATENELFEKVDWERISEKCIGCGTCTFICPTCHCFEFRDTVEKGVTSRYRCWDSCMYPKFTLHASGHNPRTSKVERYRQRVMHKYVYISQNTGYTACTGCGRCIRSCPVGMNIKSVVSDIVEGLKSE